MYIVYNNFLLSLMYEYNLVVQLKCVYFDHFAFKISMVESLLFFCVIFSAFRLIVRTQTFHHERRHLKLIKFYWFFECFVSSSMSDVI